MWTCGVDQDSVGYEIADRAAVSSRAWTRRNSPHPIPSCPSVVRGGRVKVFSSSAVRRRHPVILAATIDATTTTTTLPSRRAAATGSVYRHDAIRTQLLRIKPPQT
ncbi:Hypothetical protein CINCED_3A011194 [Cinara cedri]|uniref:Uncharacterized protein n=1 Tax=Cinara cedri TaxID=506608 RepID=A0A5E4NHV4_9HEMI|nr:Hypothetical protein CINCED_3A011194 [Cinara cedri]